ncbi:COG4223 family protein [Loktanella sp. DSM 29012]|uniref:COG4223 family protein n=1 Tax=Loktanella sp. DSM 29012 TaxID=1881056 RepID=UPI001160092E|nr:hypothetical protein [Loktanella sp. DSM 29012]
MAKTPAKGKSLDPTSATTAMPPPSIPAPQTERDPADVDAAVAVTEQPRQAETAPTPQPQQTEKRRPIFLPMAMGGLVAGLIGYGIAWTQTGMVAPVAGGDDSVQVQIDALRDDIAALPAAAPAPDMTGLEQTVADLQAELTALQDQFADLPTGATDPAAPIIGEAAQDAAVQALSQQIADQTAELQAQRDELQSQLEAIRAEAETIQANAIAGARTETARAALARIQGAVESGAPMAAVLGDLGEALDGPVPDALSAVAEEGVPTMEALREAYPEAARAALQAARQSGEGTETDGGLGGFLRSQLNVRSTAPREGTSADAILSRAEAALRSGRLNDALAEVQTLPETPRAAMTDWITLAEQRAAAIDAVEQIDTNLTAN